MLDELVPAAWHIVQVREQPHRSRSQPTQTRSRPTRGLRTDRTAQVVMSELAFLQHLMGRGHCELGTETPRPLRIRRIHRTRKAV